MDKRQQRILEKRRREKGRHLSCYEKERIKMTKTKRITLHWFDYLYHYGIPLFLSIFPVMIIYSGMKNIIDLREFTLDVFLFDPFYLFIIGLFLFSLFIKYDRLRLKTVKTNLSIETLHIVIKQTGRELNWKNVSVDDFGGGASFDPSFWQGRFTEYIIILFDKENNQVLVNSVTDYQEKGSLFSLSRNRRNEQRLIKNIKKYEKQKTLNYKNVI